MDEPGLHSYLVQNYGVYVTYAYIYIMYVPHTVYIYVATYIFIKLLYYTFYVVPGGSSIIVLVVQFS